MHVSSSSYGMHVSSSYDMHVSSSSYDTFDAMTQQTITNTSGYKMSKKDLYLLCPEIAPEQRRDYSKVSNMHVSKET